MKINNPTEESAPMICESLSVSRIAKAVGVINKAAGDIPGLQLKLSDRGALRAELGPMIIF